LAKEQCTTLVWAHQSENGILDGRNPSGGWIPGERLNTPETSVSIILAVIWSALKDCTLKIFFNGTGVDAISVAC
jgi:hypothetical protein